MRSYLRECLRGFGSIALRDPEKRGVHNLIIRGGFEPSRSARLAISRSYKVPALFKVTSIFIMSQLIKQAYKMN